MLILIFLLIIFYILCKNKEYFTITPTPNIYITPAPTINITPTPIADPLINLISDEIEIVEEKRDLNNLKNIIPNNLGIYDTLKLIEKELETEDKKFHISKFMKIVSGELDSWRKYKNFTVLIPVNAIIDFYLNLNFQDSNIYHLDPLNFYINEGVEYDKKNLKNIISGINYNYDFVAGDIKYKRGIIHIVNFIFDKTKPYKKKDIFSQLESFSTDSKDDNYISKLYALSE